MEECARVRDLRMGENLFEGTKETRSPLSQILNVHNARNAIR